MITVPTTFILGAGASQPYGYPTGDKLLQDMMQNAFGLREFLVQLGVEQDVVEDFLESLVWCGLDSIDAYLSRVERHMEVGRLALAHQMLNYDSSAVNFSQDWLGYVWRRLIEGVRRPEEFSGNCLNIVTFNYDTVVERFLTNALKYTFDLTLDKAVNLSKAVSIVHVYGQLPTNWVGLKRIGPVAPSIASVREAAEGIIVLHEGKDDSDELKVARGMLEGSEVKLFLGFGFLEDNLRRLRLGDWLRPGKQAAFGTTFGLTEGELRRIRKLFPATHPLTPINGKCEAGVRECVDRFTT